MQGRTVRSNCGHTMKVQTEVACTRGTQERWRKIKTSGGEVLTETCGCRHAFAGSCSNRHVIGGKKNK